MLTFFKRLGISAIALVNRILYCLLQILVLIDLAAHTLICIPMYVFTGHSKPNPYETISSTVGEHAQMGKKWALVCEWIIDRLFYVFNGFKLGHCRSHIETWLIDWENASRN